MKNNFLLFGLILGSIATAQPTFRAIAPPIGTSYNLYTCTSPMTHASLGSNQTWDYSAVTPTFLLSAIWIDYNSVSQQLKDSFPDATLVRESSTSAPVETKFFKDTGTEWLNYGSKNSGNQWTMNHPPRTEFKDTMNFGEFAQLTNGYATTYVGYGTLTTPFGTYPNTISLKQSDPTGIGTQDTLFFFYSCTPHVQALMHYVKERSSGNLMNKFFYDPSISSSTQEISSQHTITIFPNPNNGIFSIQVEKAGKSILKISDLAGAEIYQHIFYTAGTQTLDVSFLPNGMYIVELTQGKNRSIQKIIIQK